MSQVTELLRRKELFLRLQGYHLSNYECRQLVAAGIIKGKAFRPGGRKHYDWGAVKQTLKINEATNQQPNVL